MASKTIRLEEGVYARLRAKKREDETFSETVDRLIGAPSLRELAGILDAEQVARVRRTIDEADESDAVEVEVILDLLDDGGPSRRRRN